MVQEEIIKMNNGNNFNPRRVIVIFLAACATLLLIAIIFNQNRGDNNLKLITVPGGAKVAFTNESGDIKETKRGGINLNSGKYSVVASKDGFKDTQTNVVVKGNDQTLVILLAPVSEEAVEWASKNQKAYTEAEKISGELNQQSGEEFRANNPIVSNLPHNSGYYRIDYGQDEYNNVVLHVNADQPVGRRVAIEKIKSWGYEPHDFRIVFDDFVNPFDASGASQ